MRRTVITFLLLSCAALTAAPADGDGRWPVHYVLPVQTDVPHLPAEALRMSAAELLNNLEPGIVMIDGMTSPDGVRAVEDCGDDDACLAEHLAALGADRGIRLSIARKAPDAPLRITARLIQKSGTFRQTVTGSRRWNDLKAAVARAIVAVRLQAMIAAGTLHPQRYIKQKNADEGLFEILPAVSDAASRIDKQLGILPRFRAIPAGVYPQGVATGEEDAEPRTMVTLPDFYMDRTEVPVLTYAVCVLNGACTPPAAFADDRYCTWGMPEAMMKPANCLSWKQARDYCAFRGGRLPSEAEWEAAARGQDERTYPWGDSAPDCGHAVFSPRNGATPSDGCGLDSVWDTGSLPRGAGPFGILNMAGNVWEWVADWYQPDAYRFRNESPSPQGPEAGVFRVIRGGSWVSGTARDLTTFRRARRKPDNPSNAGGFRCVYDSPRKAAR